MAAYRVLVDTDILIDYLNRGDHGWLLDNTSNRVYFSVMTRKELLAKAGLTAAELRAIRATLQRFRVIGLTPAIADRYSSLRQRYPRLQKADAVIAATAIVKRLPLMTRNWRHFRPIADLTLFAGRS